MFLDEITRSIKLIRCTWSKVNSSRTVARPLRVFILVFLGIALLGDPVGRNLVASEAVGADAGFGPPTVACGMCFGCWCYQTGIEDQQSSTTWG